MKAPFYHISLTSPAYLRVKLPNDTYAYTLGRLFKINSSGLLVSTENYPLYEEVQLQVPYTNLLSINELGEVYEIISENPVLVGQISATLFQSPQDLDSLGDGYFAETFASGEANTANPGSGGLFTDIKAYYQVVYDIQHFYPHVVMKVAINDITGITALAGAVISALTANSSVYTDPDPTLQALTDKLNELLEYISLVNGGKHSYLEMRNKTAATLYNMLQEEMIYVNRIANADRALLALSGFAIIDPPDPNPIPNEPVIKKIINDKRANTAKIYIENLNQENLIYYVEMTLTPDDSDSWKNVLTTTNSRRLLIPRMLKGQICWFRIAASSSQGKSNWSNPTAFVSRF
ncbi:MAG: hypothetical protein KA792_10355 [Bacteroidales bacterium]|nr:hypothetical protein [Bacteroidales bacterium]